VRGTEGDDHARLETETAPHGQICGARDGTRRGGHLEVDEIDAGGNVEVDTRRAGHHIGVGDGGGVVGSGGVGAATSGRRQRVGCVSLVGGDALGSTARRATAADHRAAADRATPLDGV
jgi:hypothetical protein